MRKSTRCLFWFLLSVFFISSCKKREKYSDVPASYEERLEGEWNLESVKYSSEIPNPQNPLQSIEIMGEGVDVSGVFNLSRNPNVLNYQYSFTANINLGNGLPQIPFPVSRSGEGNWSTTSDDTQLKVSESGFDYTMDVVVNEPNRQVFATSVSETVNGIFTIEVEVELEFVR